MSDLKITSSASAPRAVSTSLTWPASSARVALCVVAGSPRQPVASRSCSWRGSGLRGSRRTAATRLLPRPPRLRPHRAPRGTTESAPRSTVARTSCWPGRQRSSTTPSRCASTFQGRTGSGGERGWACGGLPTIPTSTPRRSSSCSDPSARLKPCSADRVQALGADPDELIANVAPLLDLAHATVLQGPRVVTAFGGAAVHLRLQTTAPVRTAATARSSSEAWSTALQPT